MVIGDSLAAGHLGVSDEQIVFAFAFCLSTEVVKLKWPVNGCLYCGVVLYCYRYSRTQMCVFLRESACFQQEVSCNDCYITVCSLGSCSVSPSPAIDNI